MGDSFQLKALITGVDRLSPVLAKMNATVRKNIASIAQAGQRVGLALAGTITASSIAFAEQEDAMMGLRTAMMTAGGGVAPEFQKISDLAVKLGDKLPGTTADFANMMEMLVRQGIPAQNILNGVGEAAAYMAVQMKLPPTEAAEQMAKLQDATKTLSQDMLELADATQRAFYMGVKLQDSVEFYGKASPVLGMVSKQGIKAAEIFEPFNVMLNQAGMEGGAAGNAMRKIFQEMLNKKNMRAASRAGHVKLQFSENGEFAGIQNMYAQLAKLKPLSTEKRMAALRKGWGDDAETLQALNTIIEKGAAGYKEVQERMKKQASLNERVNKSLGTLKNMWDAMTGTATNAAAKLGEVFAPEVKKGTEKINQLSERFSKFVEKNPETVRTIVAMAAAIAGVAVAIKVVNAALMLMNMNPIVLGILAAAAAAAFLVMNWDEVKKTAKEMWQELKKIFNDIKEAFTKIVDNVIEKFKSMIKPVVEVFDKIWKKIEEHTPQFILDLMKKMDAQDGAQTNSPPTPPIDPNKPAPVTIPPPIDYTQSGRNGEVKVTIEHKNAPPGTRSSAEAKGAARVERHDVGYSSFSSQYAAAMGGR